MRQSWNPPGYRKCNSKERDHVMFLESFLRFVEDSGKAQEADTNRPDEDQKARIRRATEHIKKIDMRRAGKEVGGKDTQNAGDVVELIEQPLLIFGDTVRLHENGTLWAFGKSGRPVAV